MTSVEARIFEPWNASTSDSSHASREDRALGNGQGCKDKSVTPTQSVISSVAYAETPVSQHSQYSPHESPAFKAKSNPSSPFPSSHTHNFADVSLRRSNTVTERNQRSPDTVFQQPRTPKICLCRNETKIPRPRNAFILYRQHHGQNIHARYPGITNPDVSKIAAGQWKDETPENRNYWNLLAQEEKELHQQQHPGYRYQPRRNGRKQSVSEPSSASLSSTCDKCGGRLRIIPSAPSTANPLQGPRTSPPPSPTASSSSQHRKLPSMNSLSLATPSRRDAKRHYPAPLQIGPVSQDPSNTMDDRGSAISPESKRRKFTISGGWGPGRPTPSTASFQPNAMQTPYRGSFSHPQQQIPGFGAPQAWTPGPLNLPRPSIAQMSPAQQLQLQQQYEQAQQQHQAIQTHQAAHPPHQQQTQQQLSSRPDASLTLPPLRTLDRATQHSNPIFRIVNLGKVAPPMKKPASSDGPLAVRGSIIALEGDNSATVKAVASWLEDFLNRGSTGGGCGEYAVRHVAGVDAPDPTRAISITDYLDVISTWHGRSQEMRAFLTSPVNTPDGTSGIQNRSNSSSNSSSTADSKTDGPSATATNISNSTPPPNSAIPLPTIHTQPHKSPLPVLLIPHYQLHGATTWASRIPITDAYGPADHWSWMATLWRGVLGADLTIYVKDEEGAAGGGAGSAPGNAGVASTAAAKGVEVNEGARVIVLRREKGAAEGMVEEKSLRRLGFEVGEWIRGVAVAGGAAATNAAAPTNAAPAPATDAGSAKGSVASS